MLLSLRISESLSACGVPTVAFDIREYGLTVTD